MIDPTTEVSYGFLWLVIVAVATTIIMSGVLIWAIIKLRKEPRPTVLILTLAVTTMVIVLSYALTKQNVLAALAGTGIGALAGSLTNILKSKDTERRDDARDSEQHSGHDEEDARS